MLLIFLFSWYHPSNSAFRVFDIAFVARNQMNMDVKNALPCGFANVYADIATNVCTLRISRDASCTYQLGTSLTTESNVRKCNQLIWYTRVPNLPKNPIAFSNFSVLLIFAIFISSFIAAKKSIIYVILTLFAVQR